MSATPDRAHCALLRPLLAVFVSLQLPVCAPLPAQRSTADELPTTGPVRLELLRRLEAQGGVVHAAAFSPDGAGLVTAGEAGDLRALESATGTVRWHARPSDHWGGVVAFSPAGDRVAHRGRHLTVHDARTGEVVFRRDGVGIGGFVWLPAALAAPAS